MKKYNRSLDLYALAAHAYSKGRRDLAAKLSIHAFRSPDVKTAIAVVQASNNHATGGNPARASVRPTTTASRVSTTARRQRQLSAEADLDVEEDFSEDGDIESLEELVGELDSEEFTEGDDDVMIDEESDLFEDDGGEGDAEVFSKVMAAFARKKRATARRR